MIKYILKSTILLFLIYGSIEHISMGKQFTDFIVNSPGGRIRFYTNICNYISILGFFLTLMNIKIKIVKKLTDYIMTISLPIQITLNLMFWSIYLLNPLAFSRPSIKDGYNYPVTNYFIHGLPLLFYFIDDFKVNTNFKLIILSELSISYFYIYYSYYLYKNFNLIVYPFLAKSSFEWILFYSINVCILPLISYTVMLYINNDK